MNPNTTPTPEQIAEARKMVAIIAGKEDEIRKMGFASSFLEAIENSIAQALASERMAGREEQWEKDRSAIEHRKYGADEIMTTALLHAVSALEHTNPAKKECTFKCGRPLIDCQETCQRE